MILKNAEIYFNQRLQHGAILIQSELIKEIQITSNNPSITSIRNNNTDNIEIDCQNRLILPGIIDIHSHLRDMGQENKETFRTGTKAAINSGITTVFNMPNTIPPMTTAIRVQEWKNKAKDNIFTDVGFIAGVPKNIDEQEILKIVNLGVIGFKIYPLKPLTENNWTDSVNIKKILKISAKYQIPIFIHPDWPNPVDVNSLKENNPNLLQIHDMMYPTKNERKYIEFFMNNYFTLTREIPYLEDQLPIVHFCHISCRESIEFLKELFNVAFIKKYYNSDLLPNISYEVTPHHLLLNYDIDLEHPSYGKVLPPLRNKKHSDFLIKELDQGIIKFIGTDHAPHTINEKHAPFFDTPSGFPGFETSSLLLLDKVFRNKISLKNYVDACSENPAKRFNLKNKGGIIEGNYADLIVVEKVKEYEVNSANFKTKAKFTPFENSNHRYRSTTAKIWKIFLRGKEIKEQDKIPTGRVIGNNYK